MMPLVLHNSPDYGVIHDFIASEALTDPQDFAKEKELARRLGIRLRLPLSQQAGFRLSSPPCDWPWRSSYIAYDGTIKACCMALGDRGVLGHFGETDFPAIWGGPAYLDFRERLSSGNPPALCLGCSVFNGTF